MGYELVLELGQKVGQLISKSEEKLWDIDIKNFTVSPLDQIKCNLPMHSVTWECLVLKAGKENPGTLEVMRIV